MAASEQTRDSPSPYPNVADTLWHLLEMHPRSFAHLVHTLEADPTVAGAIIAREYMGSGGSSTGMAIGHHGPWKINGTVQHLNRDNAKYWFAS